jgi:hypothetical protein
MDISQLINTFVLLNFQNKNSYDLNMVYIMLLMYIVSTYRNQIWTYIQTSRLFLYLFFQNKGIIKTKFSRYYDESYKQDRAELTQDSEGILWRIYNNSEICSQIVSAKEFRVTNVSLVERKDDSKTFRSFYSQLLIPLQVQPINLYQDLNVFFQHNLEYKKSQNKDDEKEQKQTEQNVIEITISSKTKTSQQIHEYLEQLHNEYASWLDLIQEGKKRYICFSKLNEKEKTSYFVNYDFNTTKSFDNLFFENKQELISRLDFYQNSSEYARLGIPHTLGLLFYGEPGCGKTSTIKAIAKYLNRTVICINMKHVKTIDELRYLFLSNHISFGVSNGLYCLNKNRIYVFEEIDCSSEDTDNPFLDREIIKSLTDKENKQNKETESVSIIKELIKDDDKKTPSICKHKITLGEILELLDGISEPDDRIIIFTTNQPERLDKALIRPGRIDLQIQFKKLRRVDINNLFKVWFNRDIGKKQLNQIKDYCLSQAEFGKLCFDYKHNPDLLIEKLILK